MKFSEQGFEALKGLEKFSHEVYIDQAGKQTIGYGHKLLPTDRIDVHTHCTQEFGDLLLQGDVYAVEQRLRALLHRELEQCQYDAIVCFVYNVGVNAFAGSTMLARLNANEPLDQVTPEFGRWVFYHTTDGHVHESRGLHARRVAEIEMWYGVYPNDKQEDDDASSDRSSERHAPPDAGAEGKGRAGEGNRTGEGKGQGGKPGAASPQRKAGGG